MISSSKLDAQLYPILVKQTTDLNVLRSFLYDKLNLFLADIEKAQIEITHHIQTTAALKPKDDKTIDKVTQVLRNLNAIVSKLTLIKSEFHSLIDAIVHFLENLITIKNSIELYFNQTPPVDSGLKSIDDKLSENEHFQMKINQEFDILSQQKFKLIEQMNKQEPAEIKEHDIKYINSLWDTLCELFNTKNTTLQNRLRCKRDRQCFKIEFDSIFEDVDRLKVQLNSTQEQLKNTSNLEGAKALNYEQYEKIISVSETIIYWKFHSLHCFAFTKLIFF